MAKCIDNLSLCLATGFAGECLFTIFGTGGFLGYLALVPCMTQCIGVGILVGIAAF